jgi:hypothetical protein
MLRPECVSTYSAFIEVTNPMEQSSSESSLAVYLRLLTLHGT